MLEIEFVLFVMVPEGITLSVVEDQIEEAAEAFLTGEEDARRLEPFREAAPEAPETDLESFTSFMVEDIPRGCSVVEMGVSDEACEELGKGKFSYDCGRNSDYLCCNKKQGMNIDAGGILGLCKRNQADDVVLIDLEGNEFDSEVSVITAEATKIDCAQYDYEEPEGTKCILVELTLAGPDQVLRTYENILETALDDNDFQTHVVNNGLQALVQILDQTQKPTNKPTGFPTRKPTIRPTVPQIIDPCPALTGNCTSCVLNEECLYCRGNGVCFNSDPIVRGGGVGGPVSGGINRLRFLDEEEEEGVCVGTVTSSVQVCDLPDTDGADGNSTGNSTDTDSGSVSFAAARWSVLSGVVVSTVLFSLAL